MTFISFPDISATSENGQWRIAINGSPAEDSFRDQSNFVYRLYRSDRLVREFSASEVKDCPGHFADFPHEAWVSNDGWVVVRTHTWFFAGLLVLSPDGRIALNQLHRSISDGDAPGFLDGEPEQYMGDSSAGPFWSRFAIAYFAELDGRAVWLMRTWWGCRLVIDLARGEFLDAAAIDEERAKGLEIACIQNALSAGMTKLEEYEQLKDVDDIADYWPLASTVLAAAYHAGWLQSTQSVPYLRRLEKLSRVGSTGYGPVCWAALHTLPFRQVAKISLLRMSLEPTWLSHYQFEQRTLIAEQTSDREAKLFEFPMQVVGRNPDMLEMGLSQKETLLRIGAPDFIQREAWDYDFISDGTGFTVRVTWDATHLEGMPYEEYQIAAEASPPRISSIEFIDPQWKQITMRDQFIV